MEKQVTTIGLVVRSAPRSGKRSREQLDIALSAASLGFELQLFFIGAGVMHLSAGKGHKGWKALPGLTTVTAWLDPDSMAARQDYGEQPILESLLAGPAEMAERISCCDRAMVI